MINELSMKKLAQLAAEADELGIRHEPVERKEDPYKVIFYKRIKVDEEVEIEATGKTLEDAIEKLWKVIDWD